MLSIDQTATRLRKRIPVQPVAVFMYWWNCSIFYDLTVWLSGLRRLTFTREALGSNLPGFTFENISSTMPISTPDALTHAQMRPTRLRKRITRLRKRRSGGWDTLRSVTSITQPYLWAWDDERVLCNWLQFTNMKSLLGRGRKASLELSSLSGAVFWASIWYKIFWFLPKCSLKWNLRVTL